MISVLSSSAIQLHGVQQRNVCLSWLNCSDTYTCFLYKMSSSLRCCCIDMHVLQTSRLVCPYKQLRINESISEKLQVVQRSPKISENPIGCNGVQTRDIGMQIKTTSRACAYRDSHLLNVWEDSSQFIGNITICTNFKTECVRGLADSQSEAQQTLNQTINFSFSQVCISVEDHVQQADTS